VSNRALEENLQHLIDAGAAAVIAVGESPPGESQGAWRRERLAGVTYLVG